MNKCLGINISIVRAMKKPVLTSLLMFIFPFTLYAEKMRIAVLNFRAQAVSESYAKNVSGLVRDEIAKTGKFDVIGQQEVAGKLKKLRPGEGNCSDVPCAVRIGKIISAEKILVGTVMKMEREIVITGQLVDVEKGIAQFNEGQLALSEGETVSAVSIFIANLTIKLEGKSQEKAAALDKKGMVNPNSPHYRSPTLGFLVSFTPAWSGMFNLGWNNEYFYYGFIWASVKTGLFAGAIASFRKAAGETEEFQRRSKTMIGGILIGFYTIISLLDAYVSYIFISEYNEKHAVYSAKTLTRFSISVSMMPGIPMKQSLRSRDCCCDGATLALVYRF